jgi:hypothetical protein
VELNRSSNSNLEMINCSGIPFILMIAVLLSIGGILYLILFSNSLILFSLSCSNAAK